MPRLAPDARRPWRFFSALFRTLRRGRRWETIYAVIILFLRSGIILLFSRNDVAKEFEILRKWTKKMSKIGHRRNTFGKIRRIYVLNGSKGLKENGWEVCSHHSNVIRSMGSIALAELGSFWLVVFFAMSCCVR